MTVTKIATIDVANPPEGVRLQIGVTASLIGVSVREMADAAGLNRMTLWRLIADNVWPLRSDTAAIKQALVALFEAKGATAAQLETLFHAHVGKRRPVRNGQLPAADRYGRPLNHKPASSARGDTHFEETDMLLAKQTLSIAARKAFQLFANPFDGEVQSDDQMFTNSEIAFVREVCMQAATAGRFVAVVSESGGGKTTMLADLEARIERDKRPVIAIKPWVVGMEDSHKLGSAMRSADIVASIITTLDPLAGVPQTLQARTNKARELLAKSAEAGFSHLLVIEEAHSMPENTLRHLKRLHEMRQGRRPLLGILLLGQTELGLRLDPRRASLREVTQRCEVIHLLPLDGDLQAYLKHRVQATNRALEEFIDASGIEEIRRRLTVERPGPAGQRRATSLLYPLAVNNLVTAALNVAAELGAPKVDRDVVRAV